MKAQIEILTTDKPSRLVKIKDNLFYTTTKNIPSGNYQNIYITSDEEIKEGDYGLSKLNEVVRFGKKFKTSLYKKIILTTDPKLFNDSVQFIDDEFLEWFVKNPSCEEVKVKQEDYSQKCRECGEIVKRGYNCKKGCFMKSGNFIPTDENIKYKIIFPKEEIPKLGTKEFNDLASAYFGGKPEQHIEFINENIDEFDEQIVKFKEKQKEILIQMMKDDMKAGLYVDSEKRYTKDDLKRAHWNGWLMREKLDDMVPELDYPPGLDYEEKEEYTFNEFLKQLNNER